MTDRDRADIDRCVEALIDGKREIEWEGMPYRLRDLDPGEVDSYAARWLPDELFGVELRLVWRRCGVESAALIFNDPHPDLNAR